MLLNTGVCASDTTLLTASTTIPIEIRRPFISTFPFSTSPSLH